jgi:hypothetical protein
MVMALVGICFGVAFYWLVKASRYEPEERFLTAGEPA